MQNTFTCQSLSSHILISEMKSSCVFFFTLHKEKYAMIEEIHSFSKVQGSPVQQSSNRHAHALFSKVPSGVVFFWEEKSEPSEAKSVSVSTDPAIHSACQSLGRCK